MTTTSPTLTVDEARILAGDLLGELSHAAGDPHAVGALLQRWFDVLDWPALPLVCMAALQEAFASCVVMVLDPDDLTHGRTPA